MNHADVIDQRLAGQDSAFDQALKLIPDSLTLHAHQGCVVRQTSRHSSG